MSIALDSNKALLLCNHVAKPFGILHRVLNSLRGAYITIYLNTVKADKFRVRKIYAYIFRLIFKFSVLMKISDHTNKQK